ncbi:hypothetical protein GCM10010199_58900 [Dactylosporangium roseum]
MVAPPVGAVVGPAEPGVEETSQLPAPVSTAASASERRTALPFLEGRTPLLCCINAPVAGIATMGFPTLSPPEEETRQPGRLSPVPGTVLRPGP